MSYRTHSGRARVANQGVLRRQLLLTCGALLAPALSSAASFPPQGLLSTGEGWRRVDLAFKRPSGVYFASDLQEVQSLLGNNALCVTEGIGHGTARGEDAGRQAILRHVDSVFAPPACLVILVGCAHSEGWFAASQDAASTSFYEAGLSDPQCQMPVRYGLYFDDDLGGTLCVTVMSRASTCIQLPEEY